MGYVFSDIKKKIVLNTINLTGPSGTFKLALMDNNLFNISTFSNKTVWSDISQYEIDKSTQNLKHVGYSQQVLNNIGTNYIDVSPQDSNTDVVIYADNIVYPISTIDAYCAVITKDATNRNSLSDGELIASNDLVVAVLFLNNSKSMVSSTEGVFTIKLNQASGGYLTIR